MIPFKKIFKILFWAFNLAALIVMVWAVIWVVALIMSLHEDYKKNPRYHEYAPQYDPVINPDPKYFITVKGKISPDLIKEVNLNIVSVFNTNEKECMYDASGGTAGAMVSRQKEIVVYPIPNAKGKYEEKIPLDYFQEGRCKWSLTVIKYRSSLTGKDIISYFQDTTILPKNFKFSQTTQISCKNLICHYDMDGGYGVELPRNRNYTYIINFRNI